MANLYVTVFKGMARDTVNTPVPAPEMPPLAEWSMEIGVDSNQSKPFPHEAKFIMVKATGPCCIAIGKDPQADRKYHPIESGELRWYGVYPGHKIAVTVFVEDGDMPSTPPLPMPKPFT